MKTRGKALPFCFVSLNQCKKLVRGYALGVVIAFRYNGYYTEVLRNMVVK